MTGKCKRCGEVNRLYTRSDGNYCYDCKRVTKEPVVVPDRVNIPKARKIKLREM